MAPTDEPGPFDPGALMARAPLTERSRCGIHGDPTSTGRCASCDAGIPDPNPMPKDDPRCANCGSDLDANGGAHFHGCGNAGFYADEPPTIDPPA